jgi:CsoR family transcriptional regulator, copper-sensing transcriptional repressor
MTHGYSANKTDHLARLKRIEGQVRGLQRMIDEDNYCIDVLTQVAAVSKALQSVAVKLLDEHLHHCVATAVATGGSDGDAKITEATNAIQRLLKS